MDGPAMDFHFRIDPSATLPPFSQGFVASGSKAKALPSDKLGSSGGKGHTQKRARETEIGRMKKGPKTRRIKIAHAYAARI